MTQTNSNPPAAQSQAHAPEHEDDFVLEVPGDDAPDAAAASASAEATDPAQAAETPAAPAEGEPGEPGAVHGWDKALQAQQQETAALRKQIDTELSTIKALIQAQGGRVTAEQQQQIDAIDQAAASGESEAQILTRLKAITDMPAEGYDPFNPHAVKTLAATSAQQQQEINRLRKQIDNLSATQKGSKDAEDLASFRVSYAQKTGRTPEQVDAMLARRDKLLAPLIKAKAPESVMAQANAEYWALVEQDTPAGTAAPAAPAAPAAIKKPTPAPAAARPGVAATVGKPNPAAAAARRAVVPGSAARSPAPQSDPDADFETHADAIFNELGGGGL